MDKDKQKQSPKTISEQYPSLELAYEQVKDVLHEQEEVAYSLDSKASTFIAVATAIFGVGLTIGIAKVANANLPLYIYIIFLIATMFPVWFYYRIWHLGGKVLGLKAFITLNHPRKIRDNFWHLSKEDFLYDILLHTEKAFRKNHNKLNEKAKYLEELMLKTVLETFIVLAWIIFISLVTSRLN